MDNTKRQITKIAREVSKFTVRMLKIEGVGAAEYDFIHAVRKNPGITQAALRELLTLDKGAAARRAASLEAKGYLVRSPNPEDGRSQLLYATEKADSLKNSKSSVESLYYAWLAEVLTPEDTAEFCRVLNILYTRSKAESKADFPNLTRRFLEEGGQNELSKD
ncbi:MAG: MarR family transcriptional regulator [Clostridiaceae bacterium]|nr:MarR family transcriptional regulator [Clostridiaceae bacterium]